MINLFTYTLAPYRISGTPRPVVYSAAERCRCGASIDLESDKATLTFGRVRQPDGSRPLRILRCDMCPAA